MSCMYVGYYTKTEPNLFTLNQKKAFYSKWPEDGMCIWRYSKGCDKNNKDTSLSLSLYSSLFLLLSFRRMTTSPHSFSFTLGNSLRLSVIILFLGWNNKQKKKSVSTCVKIEEKTLDLKLSVKRKPHHVIINLFYNVNCNMDEYIYRSLSLTPPIY